MWKRLLTPDGLNWWLLGGGFGISFVAVGLAAVLGGYLGTLAPELYLQWGAVLNVLMVFLLCGLAGYITAKFADSHPLKHALWASLGAVIPLLVGAVRVVNPFLIMLALVSVAGALNGGRLALPRSRSSPRP
jgi:VIT1/CCC1 family predicted Fe2+/Mn2+ transporter